VHAYWRATGCGKHESTRRMYAQSADLQRLPDAGWKPRRESWPNRDCSPKPWYGSTNEKKAFPSLRIVQPFFGNIRVLPLLLCHWATGKPLTALQIRKAAKTKQRLCRPVSLYTVYSICAFAQVTQITAHGVVRTSLTRTFCISKRGGKDKRLCSCTVFTKAQLRVRVRRVRGSSCVLYPGPTTPAQRPGCL
jgi:hypothetical protein